MRLTDAQIVAIRDEHLPNLADAGVDVTALAGFRRRLGYA